MTRYSSLVTLAMLIAAIPCEASDADPVAPMLRLEEAIELALGNNHLLASTALQISAAEEHVKALRTYRLPVLQLDAQGVRMTDSLDFTIPAGSLGSIQAQDATITIPADYGGWATFSVSQPITQQYRIGLGVDHARLDREIAAEERRWEVQRLVAEIRSTYYRISALEAGVLALRDLVTAVEELDGVTSRYLEEGLVLRSDALDVRARLARERQRLASAENGLETQREHLNQLLGRDVTTEFRVAPPYELAPPAASLALESARALARSSRAEVRTAALQTEQAETARRLALSGRIPDLSLVASYTRVLDIEPLPDQSTSVGLYLTWEPFDWGRKRHEAARREKQTEQAREGRIEFEEQIAVEVGQRWRDVRDAAALLEATRLEEEAVSASLQTDLNRYRENAAILRDVLRTEARLSGARNEHTEALAGYWSAIAALERAIGNEN